MDFCRALPATAGVVAVPASAFYMNAEHGAHLVRFACCKQLDVIDTAVDKLVAAFTSPDTA
jgi:N-succinyldiaminopimelate aminotransferase